MKSLVVSILILPVFAFFTAVLWAAECDERCFSPKNFVNNGNYFAFYILASLPDNGTVDSIESFLVDHRKNSAFNLNYNGKNVVISGLSKYNKNIIYVNVVNPYFSEIPKELEVPDVESFLYKCDLSAKKCALLFKSDKLILNLNEIDENSYLFVGAQLAKWTNKPVSRTLELHFIRQDFYKFSQNQTTRLTQFEFSLIFNVFLLSNDLIFEAYKSGVEESKKLLNYGYSDRDISHIYSAKFEGDIEIGPTTFKPITSYGNNYNTWPSPSPDNKKLAFLAARNGSGSNWVFETVITNKNNSNVVSIENYRNRESLGTFFTSDDNLTAAYFDFRSIKYTNYRISEDRFEVLNQVDLPMPGRLTEINLEEWIEK